MNDSDIQSLVRQIQGLSAEEILAFAARRYGPQIALASSLGAEDQALTDMIARHQLPIGIFTLDTGRLPAETYEAIEATEGAYGLSIDVLFPNRDDIELMVRRQGVNLFYRSVENRKACCHARKVAPLRRKLATLKAWITGLRREQAPTRADLAAVEWDDANGLLKFNPLIDWTTAQVWDYLHRHAVPVNKLHDKGYPSIGCAPCTRAVGQGEDLRAGRWWWELPQQKECGLHVRDGRLVPRRDETKKDA